MDVLVKLSGAAFRLRPPIGGFRDTLWVCTIFSKKKYKSYFTPLANDSVYDKLATYRTVPKFNGPLGQTVVSPFDLVGAHGHNKKCMLCHAV